MININIVRGKDGFIRQFIVEGHAGYGEEGSDIICAAISAIAYTGAGAIDELVGLKNFYSEKDGYMICSIPENLPEDKKNVIQVILETTAIGFKQVELEYEDYVTVLDEEV